MGFLDFALGVLVGAANANARQRKSYNYNKSFHPNQDMPTPKIIYDKDIPDNVNFVNRNKKSKIKYYGGDVESENSNSHYSYCQICRKRTRFISISSNDDSWYCSHCYNVFGAKNNKVNMLDNDFTSKGNSHELHLKRMEKECELKKEFLTNKSFGELSEEFDYQIKIFDDGSTINKNKKEDLINYFFDNYTLIELIDIFD